MSSKPDIVTAPIVRRGSEFRDEQSPSHESAYRNYIADLIMEYVTEHGALHSNPEAYRRVIAVTGRSLGTVKQWLAYRAVSPDIVSLARIVKHWRIPPAAVYPPHLASLLGQSGLEEITQQRVRSNDSLAAYSVMSLLEPSDVATVERALSVYTDRPSSTLLMRQVDSEMADEIRPGELMLVDTSVEQIEGSGIYVLRLAAAGGQEVKCVRKVERLVSEPTVRLRCGSAMANAEVETVPIKDGIVPGVTVLARVLGVLRRL